MVWQPNVRSFSLLQCAPDTTTTLYNMVKSSYLPHILHKPQVNPYTSEAGHAKYESPHSGKASGAL